MESEAKDTLRVEQIQNLFSIIENWAKLPNFFLQVPYFYFLGFSLSHFLFWWFRLSEKLYNRTTLVCQSYREKELKLLQASSQCWSKIGLKGKITYSKHTIYIELHSLPMFDCWGCVVSQYFFFLKRKYFKRPGSIPQSENWWNKQETLK